MSSRAQQALMRIYESKIKYYGDMLKIYQEKLEHLRKEEDDGPQAEVQGRVGGGNALLERQHKEDVDRQIRAGQGGAYLDPLPFRRRGITKLDK